MRFLMIFPCGDESNAYTRAMRQHIRYDKRREATVAGIFYPEGSGELSSTVASLLSRSLPGLSDAQIIVAPHGCYHYSGTLAALAWKAASSRNPRRVVILAPSHRPFEQGVFLPESKRFSTPLGDVKVDTDAVKSLSECGSVFTAYDIPHMEEHSIEVQLPFMQTLFPHASLIPLILAEPDESMDRALSAAMDLVFGDNLEDTLFVVTTNLSIDADPERCRSRLAAFTDLCLGGNWSSIEQASLRHEGPCGGAALGAIMRCSLAARLSPRLLGLSDSEKVRESEDERTVGYAAFAFS
jgi:AmmeMemoRadiSam system protein B